MESTWNQLPIWDILERKIVGKQIDDLIWPFLNQLQASIHELRIYFPLDQHSYFQEIYDNFIKLNGVLGKNLHDYIQTNPIPKANDYDFNRIQLSKQNAALIEKISKLIQQSFD